MPLTTVLNHKTIAAHRLPGYGGVVAMSELGAILYVSGELDGLLGLEHGAALGRSFLEFVHGDDVELAVESFSEIGGRSGYHQALHIRVASGDDVIPVDVVPDNRLDDPAVTAVLLHVAAPGVGSGE